jgi:molybdate transport system ATP-binding protein
VIDARIRKTFPAGPGSAAFTLDVHLRSSSPVTVLFGPSGAGKSLTLDSIAGFARPDEGRILVDDVLLYDSGAHVSLPPRRRRCGYVFQQEALFPHMSLRENLAFAAGLLPRLERRRRVAATLEQFRLDDVASRRPGELSGGQRQRGAIARALLSDPRLLLLDEPSRGLDAPLREELYVVLAEVRALYRIPVVVVTHDLNEALALGDEMHVLIAGALAQSGPPAEVVDRPATPEVARLLGTYNVFGAEITAMDPASNRSRLKCRLGGERTVDVDGPYFPGHLLGAQIQLALPISAVRVSPYAATGVPLRLRAASRRITGLRLEFEGGLAAETTLPAGAPLPQNGEWVVSFPPDALRLLR